MGKTWVLQTETKGTGATVVPLEHAQKRSAPEPLSVPRKPGPRAPAPPPEPRAPRRFRVVDVMTRQPLIDGAGAAETVEALGHVRSIVDVDVYVWQEERKRWRLLSFSEQRTLFELAG